MLLKNPKRHAKCNALFLFIWNSHILLIKKMTSDGKPSPSATLRTYGALFADKQG